MNSGKAYRQGSIAAVALGARAINIWSVYIMVTARIFHAPDCVEIIEFNSENRVTSKVIKTVFYCINCQLEIDGENKTIPALITTESKGYVYLEATMIKLSSYRAVISDRISFDYLRRQFIVGF